LDSETALLKAVLTLRKVLSRGGIRKPRGHNQSGREREQEQELLPDNSPIENLILG
jgi:hypothetical protein